jgi:uncharacterized protein (DUF885 family)
MSTRKPQIDSHEIQASRALAEAGERYIKDSLELFPQEGTNYGFEEYDDQLSPQTPEVWNESVTRSNSLLSSVESIPAALLAGDDWIDRRALISLLRTHLLSIETLKRAQNNPQFGVDTAVDSIFRLVINSRGNLARKASEIESRLSKIPAFLDGAASCVRLPVPLWTKLAAKACDGAVEFLTQLEPELVACSKNSRRTRTLIEKANASFVGYKRRIVRCRPGPTNGYSIGREHFEYLTRERLGVDWSLPEIQAEGYRLLEQYSGELEREAHKFGSGSAREILDRLAAKWDPGKAPLLDTYKKITKDIKARLNDLDIVSLPEGESLRVLPVPPFMRHQFPTAAYSSAGAFAKRQEGIFWVNDLSLHTTNSAKRQAERAQHFGMELTSAHEAYPGHHLQFAIQHQHPSKIRRIVAHAIFYEGWTLWCERMSVERGLFEARHAKLLRLQDATWRACRIVIDCGLHSGDMNYNQACRFLVDRVGFTMGRAGGDVNWYTSAPTVPMSYLLGLQEVQRLHERFVKRERWSLRKFNDWMLSYGAVPWAWIEEAERLNG